MVIKDICYTPWSGHKLQQVKILFFAALELLRAKPAIIF